MPASEGVKIRETDRLQPISVYGAAKAATEIFGNALAASLNLPFITLRLFGVFGVGEGSLRLIPYLIRRLRRGDPVDLTGGEQVRDFLYIDDVVEALIIAGSTERLISYEAYNVCSSRSVTIREIGEAVADEMHRSRDLLLWGKRPYRRDEPMWLVGDNRRFVEATQWHPKVDLLDGIRRTIELLD
jgi:nucleoside-diphosphate-sugar epimerase